MVWYFEHACNPIVGGAVANGHKVGHKGCGSKLRLFPIPPTITVPLSLEIARNRAEMALEIVSAPFRTLPLRNLVEGRWRGILSVGGGDYGNEKTPPLARHKLGTGHFLSHVLPP